MIIQEKYICYKINPHNLRKKRNENMERKAAIVSAVRTPVCKAGGSLAAVQAYELGAAAIEDAVKRADIDCEQIDIVVFGNTMAHNTNNIARVAALKAGLPVSVPGITLDIQCGSGLAAVSYGAMLIESGRADIVVAGGVESDSNRPFVLSRTEKAYSFSPPVFLDQLTTPPEMGNPVMGITAENIAERYGITREECDEFALRSHAKAARAWNSGRFESQIVPIEVKTKKNKYTVDRDETVRFDCNMESLAKLRPVFKKDGVVTAGGSSPTSDGGGALVLMESKLAERMGKEILATIGPFAIAGVDPLIMGTGPIAAVRKLLRNTGLSLSDFDLIELNEAFAAQSICCIRELGMNEEIVNVNGGALALGHPLGGTGAILTTKIVYEMRRRDVRKGLVTFCCGGGEGIALIVER